MSDMALQVRVLTAQDAADYQAVRLQSLQDHPEAFGSSFEDEAQMTIQEVTHRLTAPGSTSFGAFADGQLIGIVTLGRNLRPKLMHRAMIGGMYVSKEVRGRGIGRALLETAISHASTSPEVEDLTLAVTCGNASARALYLKVGFKPYSVDPRLIRVGEQYFDIEWMILSLREGKAHGGR